MKRFATICTLVVLCFGQASVLADKDKDKDDGKKKQVPPGLAKKDGVPPGLAKKDGLPPGIAKKQEERQATGTTTPAAAPASTPTPAPAPAPAAAPAPTAPASTPAPAPAPVATTVTTTKPAQPAGTASAQSTFEEQKAKLHAYIRTINESSKGVRLNRLALRQISAETGVPYERLEQQEKAYPGIGEAALLVGNLIAKKSGKPFETIIQGRAHNKGWAEIARYHQVPLPPLIQKCKDVASVVEAAAVAAAR